jgi:hypothetical protein
VTTRILGIVVVVVCFISGTAGATTNLKPFDPVALQGVVEPTAKELLLPGVMVLLRIEAARRNLALDLHPRSLSAFTVGGVA